MCIMFVKVKQRWTASIFGVPRGQKRNTAEGDKLASHQSKLKKAFHEKVNKGKVHL